MYEGTIFKVGKYDGSEVAAVVISEFVWEGNPYAVIGYKDEYPNVFLWSLDTLEKQLA